MIHIRRPAFQPGVTGQAADCASRYIRDTRQDARSDTRAGSDEWVADSHMLPPQQEKTPAGLAASQSSAGQRGSPVLGVEGLGYGSELVARGRGTREGQAALLKLPSHARPVT